MGFAFGPALATLVWSAFSYGPAGMRGAVILAMALSALSVLALARTPTPEGPAQASEQSVEDHATEELNA
jgi:hypothetical protein